MAQEEQDAGEGRPVVANFVVEAVVAAVLFSVGAVVMFQSRKLGAGWTSDGPGAGYFPFYIGLVLVVSSLGTLVVSVLGKGRDSDAFVDNLQFKRVLQVFVPAVVYVAAVGFLGIYVASAIYIAGFMVWLGSYPWLRSVLAGVAVTAFLFVLFEVWFKVPLYKGAWEPLRFLGY